MAIAEQDLAKHRVQDSPGVTRPMTCEVRQCWGIAPNPQTVEVLRLHANGFEPVRVYGTGESVVSLSFAGLTIAVNDIFV